MTATAFRTCPFCEATCGLRIDLDGDRVVSVRGDDEDVFSRGYLCPKGIAIGELHHDPDRLRHPLVRGSDGRLRRASWDEAFGEVARRLLPLRERYGADAVAVYLGNPNAHNVTSTLYVPALVRALGTRNRFSASTVDQMPAQVAAGLVFGTELSVPIPDVDRTDLFVVLGGNPLVSNGSLLTAPDLPGRLRALRRRGGRLVVVDPVRTRTAEAADLHLRVRPGTDAFLLAGLARELLARGAQPDTHVTPHLAQDAMAAVAIAAEPFTPDRVATVTGVRDADLLRLVDMLQESASAAVYGRMGTTTSGMAVGDGQTSFGTAASWWITVVNVLTGNLDRPGGVMWPTPPAGGPTTSGTPGRGRGIRIPGSGRTRVRGLPSVLGEFPAAALAEEIDTPSEDGARIRALITIAGNPVVSTPDGARLDAALADLDLLVCVDAYVTETSRHADVVLPPPSPLARSHYDVVFANLAIRNVARWTSPSLPLREDEDHDERDEGETLLRLACIALGDTVDVDTMDDLVAAEVARRACEDAASRAVGRSVDELLAATAPRRRQERLLDIMLRSGPFGDGFGSHPGGLTLDRLLEAPHGIDLGPMAPRLPEVLRTHSGQVDLAAPALLAEAERMAVAMTEVLHLDRDPSATPSLDGSGDRFLLVGRRGLRSNNSWLHNLPLLSGGTNRCTLWLHPEDAARLSIRHGSDAVVSSATGAVTVEVEVTDAVSPGVACLPHGWGHSVRGTWGETAAARPGVNSNVLTPSDAIDPLAGTAVLNGISVTISPV